MLRKGEEMKEGVQKQKRKKKDEGLVRGKRSSERRETDKQRE